MTWKLPETPKVATDIIIEYQNGVVLIDRKYPPYGLALPGGFYELGITAEVNSIKESKEETGLDVLVQTPQRPLCYMSNPKRDPRGHITSVAYVATGTGILKPHKDEDAKAAYVLSIDKLVEYVTTKQDNFAFADHVDMLKFYLEDKGYL